jgi:hypothetical protein
MQNGVRASRTLRFAMNTDSFAEGYDKRRQYFQQAFF